MLVNCTGASHPVSVVDVHCTVKICRALQALHGVHEDCPVSGWNVLAGQAAHVPEAGPEYVAEGHAEHGVLPPGE